VYLCEERERERERGGEGGKGKNASKKNTPEYDTSKNIWKLPRGQGGREQREGRRVGVNE